MVKNEFEIIDIHAHLGRYFQFPIRQNKTKEIVDTARSYGIKKMCVSHTFTFLYDSIEGNLLTLNAVKKYPDLFLFGGLLDPRWDEKKIEKEFFNVDPEVSMWNEMHPALQEYPISGEGYKIILDLVRKNPKPVLFHTDQNDRYSKPGQMEELMKLYPEIPFIIGHSGNVIGGFEIAVDIIKKYDNAFLDSTFSRNYLGIMKWMIQKVGAEKILFGTDMPFLNGAAEIGKMYEPGISDNERQKIFHDNAAKLLQINC
ncbi:MAG: amidohydrolase family protein [Ignavibacteria bacterium]|jgi:predicted TIM-barrel fold metal-dependent hydrolase